MVACVEMMSKGSKEALTVLIVTHVTVLMSNGSKVVFVAYVHNIDTFNAMSKGSKGLKDYVMLKQGTNTFSDLSDHTIQCHVCQRGRKLFRLSTPSTCFNKHCIGWYGWKCLSLSFPKLFLD